MTKIGQANPACSGRGYAARQPGRFSGKGTSPAGLVGRHRRAADAIVGLYEGRDTVTLLSDIIDNASEQTCRKVLKLLLERYLTPAFGTLPKREIDLLFFEAFEELGFIELEPKNAYDKSTIYQIVQRLRVTSRKARNLLYDRELRRFASDDLEEKLDERVREALKHPIVQKQGDLFVLEIENPLVIDHLRARMKSLGYAADGSFSPTLVKLPGEAIASLIESYMSEEERRDALEAFREAGVLSEEGVSLRKVLKGVFMVLGRKMADEAGAQLAEQFFGLLVDKAFPELVSLVQISLRKSEDSAG